MSDLKSRFLKRFLVSARARVDKGLELLGERSDDKAPAVTNELHTLAGEASMLGFNEIADVARNGENDSRDWETSGNKKGMVGAMRALRTLNKMVTKLAAESGEPEPAPAPAPTPAEPAVVARAAQDGPLRVLVVDDSPINATVLCDALEDEGYLAESGDELAPIMAQLTSFKPQVILTDVNMPDLDLQVLIDAVRADVDGKNAKIYLVSGMSAAELTIAQERSGADGFVSKDDGLDAIIAQVRAIAGQ